MSEILNDRYEENRDVSLSAFDQYLCVVRWAEAQPLSDEEQYKYFQRLVRARRDPANGWLASLAKDACDVLVEKYQPIVYCLVRWYARCCRGMEILDLVQEANIGLLRGLRTFDLDFDLSSFRAWLVGCARMSLRKVYWDQCGFVRFP